MHRDSGVGSRGDCHQETWSLYTAGIYSLSEAVPKYGKDFLLRNMERTTDRPQRNYSSFGGRSAEGKIDFPPISTLFLLILIPLAVLMNFTDDSVKGGVPRQEEASPSTI